VTPFKRSFGRRLLDAVMKGFVGRGLGPKPIYLLSVRGRKSGAVHVTPVTLVGEGDRRWLVAPYGEVGWVKNLRAAGRGQLRKGSHVEEIAVRELAAPEGAPVLKRYLQAVPMVKPYFRAKPDSPVKEFEGEAQQHPAFEILPPP
jgi:deazaflavin-dependent oxidoreductase (nitroreductase family)